MHLIIKHELLFALNALKDGGSIMLVAPTSDHASTFFYISRLLPCCNQKGTTQPIRIIPTNKPARNPVYILFQNIQIESSATVAFKNYLAETDVTVENDDKWALHSWEEASDGFNSCRSDLEALWEAKWLALYNDRIAAEETCD